MIRLSLFVIGCLALGMVLGTYLILAIHDLAAHHGLTGCDVATAEGVEDCSPPAWLMARGW